MYILTILALLLCFSLRSRDSFSFDKNKMPIIKVCLAVLIVFHHLSFLGSSSIAEEIRLWGRPVVSVFFLISGYGLNKSFEKRGLEYLNGFIRHRIIKVVLPALLATTLFWCVSFNPSTDYLGIFLSDVKTGSIFLPNAWFVVALIILYVFFYISYKYLPSKCALVGLFLITGLLVVLLKTIGYPKYWWLDLMAFPAGALFCKYEGDVYRFFLVKRYAYPLVCVGLIALMALLFISGFKYGDLCWGVLFPLTTALLVSKIQVPKSDVTIFLSGISYEIYLSHGIVIFMLKQYMSFSFLFIICVFLLSGILAYLLYLGSKLIYSHAI